MTISAEITNTIKAYDEAAHQFDEKIASLPNYKPTYEELSKLIPSDGSILDLACGPGNISRFLKEKNPSRKITGIDLSKEMLKIAKSHIPDGTFLCQSIVDFNLPPQTPQFDAVINGFGLPYLNDDESKLSIAASLARLKKGGIFYVSFMNGTLTREETPSFNTNVKFTVHYHNQDNIEAILSGSGLSIIRKWNLNYTEADGSITTDVVFLCRN